MYPPCSDRYTKWARMKGSMSTKAMQKMASSSSRKRSIELLLKGDEVGKVAGVSLAHVLAVVGVSVAWFAFVQFIP